SKSSSSENAQPVNTIIENIAKYKRFKIMLFLLKNPIYFIKQKKYYIDLLIYFIVHKRVIIPHDNPNTKKRLILSLILFLHPLGVDMTPLYLHHQSKHPLHPPCLFHPYLRSLKYLTQGLFFLPHPH